MTLHPLRKETGVTLRPIIVTLSITLLILLFSTMFHTKEVKLFMLEDGGDRLSTRNIKDTWWKKELFSRLDRIRSGCGTLCEINSAEDLSNWLVPNVSPDLFPTAVVPDVDCSTIMSMEEIYAVDRRFPFDIPEEIQRYFTMDGAVELKTIGKPFGEDLAESGEQIIWTQKHIETSMKLAREGTYFGSFGEKETNGLYRLLSNIDVKGKTFLVIGSLRPWVEAILLDLGAENVTTLDDTPIKSEHPRLTTETPQSFREKYVTGMMESFDGIVSHSSVEHYGLGRYGEALNPWGDVLAVARAWCVTNEGGFMYLGVPQGPNLTVAGTGEGLKDSIEFNAHRMYGDVRWPLLTANWKQVSKKGEDGKELLYFNEGPMHKGYVFEKVTPPKHASGSME